MKAIFLWSNTFHLFPIAAPYLETVEEMTANEFFRFHQSFKSLMPDISIQQILERVGLKEAAEKQITVLFFWYEAEN